MSGLGGAPPATAGPFAFPQLGAARAGTGKRPTRTLFPGRGVPAAR
jgi:hypothetical protein